MTEPEEKQSNHPGLVDALAGSPDFSRSLQDLVSRSAPAQAYRHRLRTCNQLMIPSFFPEFQAASMTQLTRGYDRPYTDAMIDSAFGKLPSFLADALTPPEVPAILIGRYRYKETDHGLSTGLRFLAKKVNFECEDEARDFILTEIAILDFPSSMKFGSDALSRKQALYLPQYTFRNAGVNWSNELRQLFAEHETTALGKKIETNIKSLSFDQIATEGVLHELGHVVWLLLPEKMKEEWKNEVYPMWPGKELSGIYLRSMVYGAESPLFYEEAFADKWARAFPGKDAEAYESVGRTFRKEEERFMLRVLEYLHGKLQRGLLIHEIDPERD